MYIPSRFQLGYNKKRGRYLIANKNFNKTELIIQDKGIVIRPRDNASPNSVQIGRNKFADTDYRILSDTINHSCDPNTTYDKKNFRFIAIKDIKRGEELTFNYLSTEWDLKTEKLDFDCFCECPNCFGHINGYKYLSKSKKRLISPKPFLSS